MNEQSATTVRLPEWKHCLEQMRTAGLEYGKVFTADFFETHLQMKRDTMAYSLAISEIRKTLEKEGMFLSGHGQKGESCTVLPPEENAKVGVRYAYAASDALRRAHTLLSTTPLETLTADQRTKHEQVSERIAVKLALMNRSATYAKKLKPGTLQLP